MVTVMQMVFNELSTSKNELPLSEISDLISTFVKTYSEVLKTQSGMHRSIATPINFNDLELAPGYYLAQWRNAPTVDKDEKMRFLGICERQTITTPSFGDTLYVQHTGDVGTGLQIAYEKSSPLISFRSNADWEKHSIQCEVYDIESEKEYEISLKNLFSVESVKEHSEWVKERIQEEYAGIDTPAAFLSQYQKLFPSLCFHRDALDQMRTQINPVNVLTIVEKLLILERYFSNWDGGKFDRSVFPPRFVSPESEESLKRFKKQHTYVWEGHELLVSYHVRYTGGDIPGRIYIFPDHETRKCIVCSLDTKLPTVNDPK